MAESEDAGDSRKRVQQVTNSQNSQARRSKKTKQRPSSQPPELPPDGATALVMPAPLPQPLEAHATEVLLSRADKAPLVILSDDGLSATSTKGYRMVRATHGACSGTWYFEIHVKHLGATGHCRVGWATKSAEMQAPVGYDAFSFAYRDIEGVKVHKAQREQYGESFKEGDVIGCLLHLPEGGRSIEVSLEDKETLNYKGMQVVEVDPDVKPEPLVGSCIAFTRNGKLQGKAFMDILEGTYYPAGSLYTLPEQTEGATLAFNFGPEFRFGPPKIDDVPKALPVCKLIIESAQAAQMKQTTLLGSEDHQEPAPDGSADV